jgi:hypothetical protein
MSSAQPDPSLVVDNNDLFAQAAQKRHLLHPVQDKVNGGGFVIGGYYNRQMVCIHAGIDFRGAKVEKFSKMRPDRLQTDELMRKGSCAGLCASP